MAFSAWHESFLDYLKRWIANDAVKRDLREIMLWREEYWLDDGVIRSRKVRRYPKKQ